MPDEAGRAERKEYLRRIFEPYWRDAVAEMVSELMARNTDVPRAQVLRHMLGQLPPSLYRQAAETALPNGEREDMELMAEIATELSANMMKETIN